MRRIDIVFPVLPPKLDGIGDHTAHLAEALAEHCSVRILTAQAQTDALSGVEIVQAFSVDRRRGVQALYDAVRTDPPDWLLVQFNQFSYGRWGLNPYLPLTLRRIDRSVPKTRLAVLFHEDFVPVTSWKNALMTIWQRWQFWALGRQADALFFSIAPWVQKYRSWFPAPSLHHLPVGSNIPRVHADRSAVRRALDLDDETLVAGVFGTVNASRLLPYIRRAATALHEHTPDFRLLYIGPHGTALRQAMPDVPVLDCGPLSRADVSRHFAAMDLQLTPFIDGVSTRRGSFMTGLQHGIATVATAGPLTDSLLHEANGEAFILTPVHEPAAFSEAAVQLAERPDVRARIADNGRALYDRCFDFPTLASKFTHALRETTR